MLSEMVRKALSAYKSALDAKDFKAIVKAGTALEKADKTFFNENVLGKNPKELAELIERLNREGTAQEGLNERYKALQSVVDKAIREAPEFKWFLDHKDAFRSLRVDVDILKGDTDEATDKDATPYTLGGQAFQRTHGVGESTTQRWEAADDRVFLYNPATGGKEDYKNAAHACRELKIFQEGINSHIPLWHAVKAGGVREGWIITTDLGVKIDARPSLERAGLGPYEYVLKETDK